jgi:hypothetical protein
LVLGLDARQARLGPRGRQRYGMCSFGSRGTESVLRVLDRQSLGRHAPAEVGAIGMRLLETLAEPCEGPFFFGARPSTLDDITSWRNSHVRPTPVSLSWPPRGSTITLKFRDAGVFYERYMSREKRKKIRKRRVARLAEYHRNQIPEPKRPLTEADYANAIARFACMRGRGGVVIGFSPMGPRVEARNAEELREATDRALIELTEKQDPS